MNKLPTLEIIIGPMFSGKTKALIDNYNKYKTYNNCLCINHSKDNRYSPSANKIVSHDGDTIDCIAVNNLYDVQKYYLQDLHNAAYIFINEAQFFSDLKDWTVDILDSYYKFKFIIPKNIIMCGLDSDFKRQKFGSILDLIPFADKIIHLRGKCSICLKKDSSKFSHRTISDTSQEIVGNDIYKPVCHSCYCKK